MREIRDDQGRPWQLALTVAAAMRVRDNVKVDADGEQKPFDLIDVANIGQTMQVLRGQYSTIAETLYFILLPQMEGKQVSKDNFLDGLRGDSLDDAAKALEQELIDFFPKRLREMVAMLAAKMDAASEEMMEQAKAQMEQMTTAEIIAASGLPSGKQQESSASTPETGPSDSLQPQETAA